MATGYINNRNRAGMVQVHIPADQLPAADDANAILTKLKTVDGASSGLDADLLDGAEGAAFGKLATANTWAENNYFSKNVGIGTASPAAKIHANAGTTNYAPSLTYGSTAAYILNTATLDFAIGADSSSPYAFWMQARLFNNAAHPISINPLGGNVGIGTTSPAGALDITSTTGALLVPRMTTTQRDALTAADGMVIYNTTTATFQVYQNGAWESMIADEATAAAYTYGTSWDTASGALALGVKRVGNMCYLSGQVARSVTTSSVVTIATLSEGYRPTLGTHVIWTWAYHSSNYYAVALTVSTAGVITLTTSISATIGNLYFDGLFFPLN